MIPRSQVALQQPISYLRMAGDDPMVQRLLMADKYRYLEAEDYPSTEAAAVADHLEDFAEFLEGGDEYQEALDGTGFIKQGLWSVPEQVEREYEQGVALRLAELRSRYPGVPVLDLVAQAL